VLSYHFHKGAQITQVLPKAGLFPHEFYAAAARIHSFHILRFFHPIAGCPTFADSRFLRIG
jgi:hypothetical protein